MIARKIKKQVYVFNPVSFDPSKILPRNLLRHADSARYIVHRIHWGHVTKRALSGGFVPLKTDYLRRFIPKRAVKPLLTALQNAEVIERDGYFIPGHKSYAYRLMSPYCHDTIASVPLFNDTLVQSIKKERREDSKKVRLDVHQFLRGQLKLLDIDVDRAMALLEGDSDREILKLPVVQIENGDRLFKVCRFGRVHTDLTHLKSSLRTCLHSKGLSLVSIDIANSQPLFLALIILLRNYCGDWTSSLVALPERKSNPYHNIEKSISLVPVPPISSASNTTDTEMEKVAQTWFETGLSVEQLCRSEPSVNSHILKPDERRFLSLCESGALYETIMDEAEIPVRRWAKEMLFEVLYGRNKAVTPLKKRFSELFPNVYAAVRRIKRKDHCRLSRLLQNLESTVVINRVCRRLMEEKVEPVLTIHDSVLTTKPHVEVVLHHFRVTFESLGISPTFHVTDYANGQTYSVSGNQLPAQHP